MTTTPRTITVTGAAGMLGYALLFRLGVGRMLGATSPIRLRLLDLPHKMRTLEGVAMELEDCAFPLVESIDIFDRSSEAFKGANAAILVGAHARHIGMERADLLEANARIFADQGRQINYHAADDVRVIVVGNPVNTNALVAAHHAPDLPPERFTALMRLDHNRTLYQLARKADVPVANVKRVAVWGNHSKALYPDITHALIDGKSALDIVDERWARDYLIPKVAHRGEHVLETRGHTSQGSAANAVIRHMRDWYLGTDPTNYPPSVLPEVSRDAWGAINDWSSAGIWSHGEYGVPEGLVCSFPVTSDGTDWHVVEGLAIDKFSRQRIDASVAELLEEREHARMLGFLS